MILWRLPIIQTNHSVFLSLDVFFEFKKLFSQNRWLRDIVENIINNNKTVINGELYIGFAVLFECMNVIPDIVWL